MIAVLDERAVKDVLSADTAVAIVHGVRNDTPVDLLENAFSFPFDLGQKRAQPVRRGLFGDPMLRIRWGQVSSMQLEQSENTLGECRSPARLGFVNDNCVQSLWSEKHNFAWHF